MWHSYEGWWCVAACSLLSGFATLLSGKQRTMLSEDSTTRLAGERVTTRQ